MAQAKTRRRPAAKRPVQAPRKRQDPKRYLRSLGWLVAVVAISAIAVGAVLLGKEQAQSGSEGPATSAGLPDTPDYHSLLVASSDPTRIMLGTHAGLYESTDGGRNWDQAALAGQDAMNLADSGGETAWTAGHNVFARSTDGGATWSDVRPDGLPSLDIHGFTVDPSNSDRLYAAVAGQGLYRSDEGGKSFRLASKEVGGAVMALAVMRDGRILAGDMEKGLMLSGDGGKSWRVVLRAVLMGLAVNPDDPQTVVATGPGILLSTDGGKTFDQKLDLEQGAGPVAWSPSDPKLAYVVGFDRMLYRSNDGGVSWKPVQLGG
ncbi:hypothetical protein BH18ACT14_BH18ACT14_16270 [soil metagenome]